MEQFSFKVDKKKLEALKKALEAARGKLADATPAFKRAAVYLDGWVQRNFKSEGGLVGGWAPFKAGGRRVKKGGKWELDQSAKLLQDTGAMRLSYRPFAFKDNAGIGSDLPYAEDHEKGVGVPQRRTLPKDEEVKDDLRGILDDYVAKDVLPGIDEAFKE